MSSTTRFAKIGLKSLIVLVIVTCGCSAGQKDNCASHLAHEDGHMLMFLCQLRESAALNSELANMVEDGIKQLVVSAQAEEAKMKLGSEGAFHGGKPSKRFIMHRPPFLELPTNNAD